MYGVAIQAGDAMSAVEQIVQAEQAGVDSAWATMGGAGGADMLVTFAGAAMRTERIKFGTSIVHTWAKRPLAYAQEVAALEQLAPGRFRLGLGPTTPPLAARQYGIEHRKPLTHLRETITAIRTLLREGQVDFQGELVQMRARLAAAPLETPVMGSALQPRTYEAMGEVADGAISWMAPVRYLVEVALPAVQRGAERAGREAPPIVAHVPVAMTTDREEARNRARQQLGMYQQVPNYQHMWGAAGMSVTEGYGDDLLDNLVVSGTEAEVAAALRQRIEAGIGEVLAAPLPPAEGREEHFAAICAAVARAARG
jgi:alkanesulfonate monooxygenase SsuD/methylene tetrahydromethanopterin reductase-like flavin-dependent oxidoreductase (luciferase family)